MEVVYRAFNGIVFETEKECRDYEDSIQVNTMVGTLFIELESYHHTLREGKVTLIGTDTPIRTVHQLINTPYKLLYLPNFKAKRAFTQLCKDFGLAGCDDSETCVGWNYYNEELDRYYPVTDIDCFENEYRSDGNFDFICNRCDEILKHC